MTTPFRILPRVTDDNQFFWTSGADGRLRFLRCRDCGYFIHPLSPVCPKCLSRRVEPEAVSGRATVHAYTVNHQPWIPGFDPPYVVAIVTIAEQDDVRLTTNVVGCAPEDVHTGMAVRVRFEQHDEVWIPVFEPEPEPRRPMRSGSSEA